MGRIVNFDIKSSKIFDPQDVVLFMEKIENAEKAVKSALPEGYEFEEVNSFSIDIDPDTGDMFTEVWIIDRTIIEDEIHHVQSYPAYINIE